jgi:hypothetical protein
MKRITKKSKNKNMQCTLCQANFQVWLNNLRANEERKEKIESHLLNYCPACRR